MKNSLVDLVDGLEGLEGLIDKGGGSKNGIEFFCILISS